MCMIKKKKLVKQIYKWRKKKVFSFECCKGNLWRGLSKQRNSSLFSSDIFGILIGNSNSDKVTDVNHWGQAILSLFIRLPSELYNMKTQYVGIHFKHQPFACIK